MNWSSNWFLEHVLKRQITAEEFKMVKVMPIKIKLAIKIITINLTNQKNVQYAEPIC